MSANMGTSTLPVDTPGAAPAWLRGVLLTAIYIFLASEFFSIAVNSLSLGLIGVAWLAIMLVRREWQVVTTPLDYLFLAYALAEILSTVFSTNPQQSFLFSKRVLLISIVYLFASVTTTDALAKRFVAVFLGAGVVVASIGVLKLIAGDPAGNTRLGIFQFYMTTSELMMMVALLILPFVFHPDAPVKIRIAALLACVPVLISLYATVTRGAYLAAVAGTVFIALMRNKKLLMPLAAIVLLMFFFAPPYVEQRLGSIVDIHHPENASRLMLWQAGTKIFLDHPIVGVGDIDLHELFVQYIEPGPAIVWGHLHNVLLHILVTLGAVGFVVFVWMFVKIFVTEWRMYREAKSDWFSGSFTLGALAVFVGFQVMGLTEWSFGDQEVVILLWTTLGLTIGLGRLNEQKRIHRQLAGKES
jgi:O-antigen ligase